MAEPYSSTQRVKQQTQVEGDNLNLSTEDFDDLITTLLRQSRDKIDSYCRRDFNLHESETIELDGKGEQSINLPDPVHTVTEVKEDGTVVDPDDYEFKPYGTLTKTAEESVGRHYHYSATDPVGTSLTDKAWSKGTNNIEVTLTYGYYQAPKDPTGSYPDERWIIPEDVLAAEVRMVDDALQGLLSRRENTTLQIDDFTVETNLPQVTLTQDQKDMLAEHRVKGLGSMPWSQRRQ